MESIQSKFILLILSMLALCSILIGGISIYKIQQMTKKNTAESLAFLCNEKADEINNILRTTKQSVEMVASNSISFDELYSSNKYSQDKYDESYFRETRRFLIAILKYLPLDVLCHFIYDIEKAPNDTEILLEKIGDDIIEKLSIEFEGSNKLDTIYAIRYHKALEEKHPVWISPYQNPYNGIYTISYAIPIYKGDKAFGVIGMDIDFDSIIYEIAKIKIFKNGFAYLKDDNGNILYHPYIPNGKKAFLQEGSMEISRKLVNGMNIVISAPISEINHERNRLFAQIVFFIFLTAVIFIIITSEISKSMIRPLTVLTNVAKRVAQGNLDVEINISSNDEIGTLAESFKKTVINLKDYLTYINNLAYKDFLTGVQNKGAYDKAILQLENDVQKGNIKDYSIAVFDANGLKQINDTFGHEFGNKLIINSCNAICEVFSSSQIFRIGGDEFVAILTGSDYANRKTLKENFNEKMKSMEEKEDICERVSVACGIADHQGNEPVAEVFKRADKAMYENKKLMKMEKAVTVFIL